MTIGYNDYRTINRRDFLKLLAVSIGGGLSLAINTADAKLQSNTLNRIVENTIKKLRQDGKIKPDEFTAWSAYDFTAREKLLSINEEVPLQSASMVKPLAALSYFHDVSRGRLRYNSLAKKMLIKSIQKSDNNATNWLMDQVGGHEKVDDILHKNYGHIFKNTQIAERIPEDGRTYRNVTSARDYSRFLYALWNDKLPFADEIARIMSLKNRDRIYEGTKLPKDTIVIDKTGSTSRLCGDMGILLVKDKKNNYYPYTLIGIIQNEYGADNYQQWIKSRGDIIRHISNTVYDHMKQKHKLR